MNIRKLLICFASVLLCTALSVFGALPEANVTVNGKLIEFDASPIIENDRVLVPVRPIAEAMGIDISWDDSIKTLTAETNEYIVTIKVGDSAVYKNGERFETYTPAKIINGRVFVPVRALTEAFGAEVKWIDEIKTAAVSVLQSKNAAQSEITIKKYLQTALMPIGSTMYVYGGGRDAEEEACTVGVNPNWAAFSAMQDKDYDYTLYDFRTHLGLDCSGYVSWATYNLLGGENKWDYFAVSSQMAKNYAEKWGTFTVREEVEDFKPGDVMSTEGHVYIVLGQCGDGSVVIMHSNPPGVMLCGTPDKNGGYSSEAIKLAKEYMNKYYPEWCEKYPPQSVSYDFLTNYDRMRWNSSIVTDPEGYYNMKPDEILADLYN